MSAARRQDAGAVVGGLFARASATGGLAGRDLVPAGADALRRPKPESERAAQARPPVHSEPRVRLGVELTEDQTTFLRSLGRPARTGGPRALGAKFIATGLLIAALELVETVEVDMHGVAAGDLIEMASRARAALTCAARAEDATEGDGE